jgi:hypothetical protein
MKNYLNPYLIFIFLLFLGCSKNDNTQQNDQTNNSLIKTINIYDTTGTWLSTVSYEYDSQKRLNKFYAKTHESINDTIRETYSMEYSPTFIVLKKTLSSSNQFCDKITYYLNTYGLADSSIHVIILSASDSSILSNNSYQYNSEGNIMTRVSYVNGSDPMTTAYYYSNSNVDYVTFSPSNPSSNKEQFYYELLHINTLSYSNVGIRFLGKSSQNPLIRAKFESLNMDIAKYSYEYDQSGRIIHLSMRGVSLMPGYDFYSVPILKANEELYYTYY